MSTTGVTKKKYYNCNKPSRNFGFGHKMDVNLRGFLCSCNFHEKDCVKEAYNILNEYADEICKPSEATASDEIADEDITTSLSREISSMKKIADKTRFQNVESGAKNLVFIRTTIEDPVKLAHEIVKDIEISKKQKTKFLIRLVPIEITCKATLAEIGLAMSKIAEKHIKKDSQTYSVIYNHRRNDNLDRDKVIDAIADVMTEKIPDYKINLTKPDVCVIVEVIKGFALLSIVPDYVKFKKYNLIINSESECGPEGKQEAE